MRQSRQAAVIHVCPGGIDGQGGIARHVRAVSQAWRGAGLTVLDSHGGGRFWPAVFAWCAGRLLLRLAGGGVRLVHLHMAADGSIVRKLSLAALAGCFRVPVVLHVHGSRFADFVDGLGPARRLLGATMRRADAVVVLGETTRALLIERLGIDECRVIVMANAVARPSPAPRPAGPGCRILFLGRLGSRKGVPELLTALAALGRHGPAWCATLAGDGDVERFRLEAQRLGIGDRVSCPGWVDAAEVARLLTRSDLLVLPSRNEGQPMAVLEAMAAGIAVVASDVGEVGAVIRDGENGLLVGPADVSALTAAMRRLIGDAALRARLGDAARATVQAGHDIEDYCRRLAHIYERLQTGSRLMPTRAFGGAS